MIKKFFIFSKLTVVLSLLSVIIFLLPMAVFAIELNIEYPTTPTGSTITPQSTVPQYLKYVFDIGMFLGGIALIVSLAIAGVYYFLSPAIPNMQAKAKDQIFGAISGFLILLLVYLIITTINPNLQFFSVQKLEPVQTPPQSTPPPRPGVYFYKTSGCSPQPEPLILNNSTYDLLDFKRVTKSAKIVQNYQNKISYVSILFESPNFTGRCFYLNPNIGCNSNIDPFASAASIYEYNFYPASGKIIFYREPFFNKKGGYFIVNGAETSKIYFKALQNLNYAINHNGNLFDPKNCTVPKEKMDCVAWDDTGLCTKRKCPSLAGENIGSIEIVGEYVVLLSYIDPASENGRTSWSLCQSFPAPDDKMRSGPNKIKWEDILNKNRLPNYVTILPVKDNTNPDTEVKIEDK